MAAPTRDVIKAEVLRVLANISGFPPDEIAEGELLDDDLGLGSALRGALAAGFTNIVRKYNAHTAIPASTCKKLETVKEAIDLVFKKAGGS